MEAHCGVEQTLGGARGVACVASTANKTAIVAKRLPILLKKLKFNIKSIQRTKMEERRWKWIEIEINWPHCYWQVKANVAWSQFKFTW